MKKIYLSLFLIIIFGSSLFPQLKYDFPQFGRETVDFIKQPAKWDGSDWLKLGLVSAGTVLIMETVDQPVRNTVLKDQRYYKSVPIEFGRMYGELYSPVVFFGGFAIHSLLTNDITSRKIAYEIGQASLYAGALTYLLKMAIGRSRPYTGEGMTSFHPFSSISTKDFQSMPGGHNAAAFVISTVLSRNVNPGWLKVLLYLPAALTFVSRVYQDQHWVSDDIMGAALGYFVATWVVDQHENKTKSVIDVSSAFPLSISIALN
jgi:membrane-associated phospholipid phosphatase